MTQRPPRVTANRLHWAISAALLGTSLPALGDGLVAAPGPNGYAVLSEHNGVPALAIVRPDGQGLSDNHMHQFNVGQQGLVLNNSLVAGQAQLGPQLDANPHLQGQAASTILMRVVGQGDSRIDGPQEIFGQRADYLLSNPNGISLNGASFINANRATFLVGIPELEDGRIVRLDASHERGVLQVGERGASNAEGALDLITPRLDTEGRLTARDDLNVLIGRNSVAYADRSVLGTTQPTAGAVDAQLLGAMHAGRIRIISTTEGAGVRMPKAQLVGRDGVEVASRGDVQISGSQARNGVITSTDGDVRLHSGGDLQLTAVDVEGGSITAKAGKALRMDTLTREQVTKAHDQWSRKAWFIPTEEYSKRTTDTTRQHLATRFEARKDIQLESGADMHLTAAQLKAPGDLSVHSGGNLTVDAALDSKASFQTVRHRKHLWRGDSNTTDVRETARGSNLEGGTVQLTSAGDTHVRGSRLHSQGPGTLRSAGNVTLDGVSVKTSHDKDDYRGDLVGGAFFSKTVNDERRSSAPHRTEVRSENNLQIIANAKVALVGPKVSAAGTTQIKGEQGVDLLPAVAERTDTSTTRTQGFTVKAGETKAAADDKAGSKQYFGEVGYARLDTRKASSAKAHVATEVSGDSVAISDSTAIKLVGAKVDSQQGTQVQAPDIALLAALDAQHDSEQATTKDGALRLTGGMDRVGSAFSGGVASQEKTTEAQTHQATTVRSKGTTQVLAKTLHTEAASISGERETRIQAVNATLGDAHDLHKVTQSSTSTRGHLGASVEYTDLTRPIEKVVNGEDQSRFQHQALEDNLFAPSVGADLEVNHLQRKTTATKETARVTEVSGAGVTVNVEQQLTDIGTRHEATAGTLAMTLGSHEQRASHNREATTLDRLDVDVRARADTNTGSDINAKVVGSGGSVHSSSGNAKAVPSLNQGHAGVQIQLGTDGRYEGSRFASTEGPVAMKAGGTVALEQAKDAQQQASTTIDGSAWAKGGTSPTAGKSMGGSAIGKYTTASSTDSQGRAVAFDTPGAVSIHAGKQVNMDGPRVGAIDRPVASIEVIAGDTASIGSVTDTHQADGQVYGGGLQLSLSRNAPQGGKGGGIGASLELGQTDERSTTAQPGEWHVKGSASVEAGSSADTAINVEGLNVNAQRLALKVDKGGIAVGSGQTDEQRNNKSVGIGLGVNGANSTEGSKGYNAVHGRATLGLDKLASQTHRNSEIRVEQLQIDSRRDTRLSGVRVEADQVSGNVGGDLVVASRQDQVNGHAVTLDARLNAEKNPQGLVNGATALAGPAGSKVKEQIGTGLQKVDLGFAPTLHLDVNKTQRDTASAASVVTGRNGIAMNVDGDTHLNGAQLKSPRGQVDLGGSNVNTTTLSGSDHSFGLEGKLSLVPEEMTQNLINAFTGTADGKDRTSDLGLLRTKGHDQQQTLEGGIKHKEG